MAEFGGPYTGPGRKRQVATIDRPQVSEALKDPERVVTMSVV